MKREFYDCTSADGRGAPVTVTADSHKRAATRYAEQLGLGVGGKAASAGTLAVMVRKRGEAEAVRFSVEWAVEVVYVAREVA